MPYLVVRKKVPNFPAWLQRYNRPESLHLRQKLGIAKQHLLRNPDDATDFVIVIEVDDVAAAREAIEAPALRVLIAQGPTLQRTVYYPNGEERRTN